MNRRTFFGASVAAAAVASLSLLAAGPGNAGSGMVDFQPGVIQTALDSGKTVLVDYAADWCSTCAAQERAINALRAENPAYDQGIMFVRVNWDSFRRHEVTTSRGVPRRSTLVLLRGDQELGRLVADTRKGRIKELLDLGLAAS